LDAEFDDGIDDEANCSSPKALIASVKAPIFSSANVASRRIAQINIWGGEPGKFGQIREEQQFTESTEEAQRALRRNGELSVLSVSPQRPL
jgi:hypothetical protein